MSHTHSHDTLDAHGHSHEILDGPGSYLAREAPIFDDRDWKERAFTVGIGGLEAPPQRHCAFLLLTDISGGI